ncbi:hypothetical protein [Stappia sp.]|uniref:hypothetical protein n=1 Tax=Stappia sp. TaxID=1870903 RepID=UPI003A993F33
MKKTIIALAALTSFTGAALAQAPSFAEIDVDQNGELSIAELATAMPNLTQEAFNTADADGNGSLSKAEFEVLTSNSGG